MADLGVLVSRHQVFHQALPRVSPFYAVKYNSSPWMLRVLAALGTSFDCAIQVSLGQLTHSQAQHFLGKKGQLPGVLEWRLQLLNRGGHSQSSIVWERINECPTGDQSPTGPCD